MPWLTWLRQDKTSSGVVEGTPRHRLRVHVARQLHRDDGLAAALETVRVPGGRPAVTVRGWGRRGQPRLIVFDRQLLHGGVEVVVDGGLHEHSLIAGSPQGAGQPVGLGQLPRRRHVEVGVGHAVQVVRVDGRLHPLAVRGVRGQVGRRLVQRTHVVVVGWVGRVAGAVGAAVVLVVVGVLLLLLLNCHHRLRHVRLHRHYVWKRRHHSWSLCSLRSFTLLHHWMPFSGSQGHCLSVSEFPVLNNWVHGVISYGRNFPDTREGGRKRGGC